MLTSQHMPAQLHQYAWDLLVALLNQWKPELGPVQEVTIPASPIGMLPPGINEWVVGNSLTTTIISHRLYIRGTEDESDEPDFAIMCLFPRMVYWSERHEYTAAFNPDVFVHLPVLKAALAASNKYGRVSKVDFQRNLSACNPCVQLRLAPTELLAQSLRYYADMLQTFS
jgi:hypothetical protein